MKIVSRQIYNVGLMRPAQPTKLGATALTGKAHSAVLALAKSTLEALRKKHEKELENWWHQRFGFDFDCLTESEAHYPLNTPSADRVRNQITAAIQV